MLLEARIFFHAHIRIVCQNILGLEEKIKTIKNFQNLINVFIYGQKYFYIRNHDDTQRQQKYKEQNCNIVTDYIEVLFGPFNAATSESA